MAGETTPPPRPLELLLQTSFSLLRPLLAPREIALNNGVKLRPNTTAAALTVEQVAQQTDNLPNFLATHLPSIAREIFGDQYDGFAVGDPPTVSDQINLLTKLIGHADDLKLKVALANLGFSESERSDSPETVIASLQAAGIGLVQQDYLATHPRGAVVPTDDRRREVYTIMSSDFGKSLTLRGEDMKAVEKVVELGDDKIRVPLTAVHSILVSTVNNPSAEEKVIAGNLLNLLDTKLSTDPSTHQVTDLFRKVLANSPLTDPERQQLKNFVDNNPDNEAIKQWNKTLDVASQPDFAYTAREDLMAAQEIFNSQLPPVLIKELEAKEKELRDEPDEAQKKQLAQELVKRRQTFYRAILKAYNVHGERAEELNFTDEENRIAQTITLRGHQEIIYTDFQGSARKTHRGGLNAIDANRLATSELISTFSGGKEAAEKLKDRNTWNSILMDRHTEQLTKEKPEHQWREKMMSDLGIAADRPEYLLIQQILIERLNTDQRLAGIQDKLQSRFQRLAGGVLPENLVLNVFRSMGLKGIELLYRRSLTTSQQPVQLPPELADLRIQPLAPEQKQNPLSAVLGKLKQQMAVTTPAIPADPVVPPIDQPPTEISPAAPTIEPPTQPTRPPQPERRREIITVPITTQDILLVDAYAVGLTRKQLERQQPGLSRHITEFVAEEARQLTPDNVTKYLEKNHLQSLFINADVFHVESKDSHLVRRAIRDAQSKLTPDQVTQYFQDPTHRFDIFKIYAHSISPSIQHHRFRISDAVIDKLKEVAGTYTPDEMRSHLANNPFETLEYDTQLYTEALPFSNEVKAVIQDSLRGLESQNKELDNYLKTHPQNILKLSWESIVNRPDSVVPYTTRGIIREVANSLRLVPAPPEGDELLLSRIEEPARQSVMIMETLPQTTDKKKAHAFESEYAIAINNSQLFMHRNGFGYLDQNNDTVTFSENATGHIRSTVATAKIASPESDESPIPIKLMGDSALYIEEALPGNPTNKTVSLDGPSTTLFLNPDSAVQVDFTNGASEDQIYFIQLPDPGAIIAQMHERSSSGRVTVYAENKEKNKLALTIFELKKLQKPDGTIEEKLVFIDGKPVDQSDLLRERTVRKIESRQTQRAEPVSDKNTLKEVVDALDAESSADPEPTAQTETTNKDRDPSIADSSSEPEERVRRDIKLRQAERLYVQKRHEAEKKDRGDEDNGNGIIAARPHSMPPPIAEEEELLNGDEVPDEATATAEPTTIPVPEAVPSATPRTQMYSLVSQRWSHLRSIGNATEAKGYGNVLPAFQFNMSDETYAAIAREAMRQVAGRNITSLDELESDDQRMEILRLATQAYDLSDMIKPGDIPDLITNLQIGRAHV